MKKIFRYLTGELNGYWVQAFAYFFNDAIADVYTLFNRMRKLKIKFETDEDFDGSKDAALTTSDLYNLTVFSGLFQPKVTAEVNVGSIRLVPPEDAAQYGTYSERGLLNKLTSSFEFFRLAEQEYENDITTLATENLQASMVPENSAVLGYIYATDTDMLDEEGNVIISRLHSSVPVDDTPYVPFYGNKYLHLAESIIQTAVIPDELLLNVFKICQRIRYNGSSIEGLCGIFDALFPDREVQIVSITSSEVVGAFILKIVRNGTSEGLYTKMSVLNLLINYKFKQFVIEEE